MADYTVLSDVGNILVNLLRKKMTPEPISKPEMIELCAPNDSGDFQLTVFLYHVEEKGDMARNTYINRGVNNEEFAPMPLRLYYLITAFSKTSTNTKASDENKILGKAMQVLRDNSVISGEFLTGSLNRNSSNIQIQMQRLSHEQLLKIWSFPNVPYKLSVGYIVEPIWLDSTKKREVTRVVDIQVDVSEKKLGEKS